MDDKRVILVVDDEIQIRRFLKLSLTSYGYTVYEAKNGDEALTLIPACHPDLVILDLGLPDIDGAELLRQVREWSDIPVIVLTVRDSEEEKIALLENGADDYLTKPFSVGELKARITVALRHGLKTEAQDAVITAGVLKIDLARRIVTVNGNEIRLTPLEYSFLTLLAKHAGKVVTQNQIMRELWGPNLEDQTHYLRIYAMQLRRKIEEDPSDPKILLTEPGVGYRLVAE